MIDAKFRLMFFDRQSVTDPVEREALKAQSKFGAFVMRSARQSIKDRPGVSPPGTPPHAHTRFETAQSGVTKSGKPKKPKRFYPFKASILFGYDARRKTTIVGPQFRTGSRTRPTVPEALEKGGTASIVSHGERATARIRPRPFMVPALERESPKFVGLFRGIIGG